MSILVSRGWPLMVVAMLVALASVSMAQPQKSIKLTKGEFEFNSQGKSYKVPLSALGSSLDTYMLRGKEVFVLGLVYSQGSQAARMTLERLSGPGKYSKANIFNFAVGTDVGKGWNFNKASDDCTFSLKRLDPSGIEGTVSCKTTGTNAPPFTEAKLTAMP